MGFPIKYKLTRINLQFPQSYILVFESITQCSYIITIPPKNCPGRVVIDKPET